MDSFEINNDGYDLSALRGESRARQSIPDTVNKQPEPKPSEPSPAERIEYVKVPDPEPQAPVNRDRASSKTKTDKQEPISVDPEEHRTIVTLTRFFADGRLRIFFGIFLILIAGYMLVASISFLSSNGADQSIIQNRTASEIAADHTGIENSAGWFGALTSHLLMYRWLGLGGFIIIFYIAALGIGLVRLKKIQFWQLTFKSLVAAISVSIIAGFATYATVSPTFWGGLHGYDINEMMMSSTSIWGAGALSILLLSALILIFATPIKNGISHFRKLVKARKDAIARRYQASMAAAKATLEKEKAEKEKAFQTAKQAQQSARSYPDPITTSDEPHINKEPERNNLRTNPELTEIDAVTDKRTEMSVPLSVPSDTAVEVSEPIWIKPQLQPDPEEPMTALSDDTEEQPDEEPAGQQLAEIPAESQAPVEDPVMIIEDNEIEEAEEIDIDAYDPTAELSRYRFPDIDLLHQRFANGNSTDEAEQEENKQTIIRTLHSYGIEIESIKATVGPTITLYEIVPAQGVRIAKIKRLGDDMTLSLSAIGIRIIAPMPGKGTIGMEVPNKNPQVVSIRSILSSKAYHESTAELPMALGTTISNDVYVTDLAKMPHLLVAGATGMGKSVGLNTIIASLLYKKHPAELKFVLVDPKMVEFSLYKSLERHFLAKLPEEDEPIITDPNKVVATLNSLCLEMDNRYALLSKAGMRGIKEYNQKFISRRLNPEKGHRYLPYIVVIIDEFADLILTAGKEVETPISRIAAKARAVGIHMILATQRPSVNVITGVIKANFPGRMAFRVTQMNDSRTILDRPGADQLIGRGDMLISRDGVIERVQCAFIDTDEVEAICHSISDQMGYPSAYELPEALPVGGEGGQRGAIGDRDPMFADAGREVIASNMGSASLLQRKFNIGYPRAGKLIDQLEAAGVVGAASGAGKPRPVLMDLYAFENLLEQS